MSFSSGVKLGDLDDFLSPASECVKPEEKKPDLIKKKAEVAAVALSDCLACVGCVTSAETVLLTQQSVAEFLAQEAEPERQSIVITLSSASRKALARHWKIPATHIAAFVERRLGHLVLDLSFFEALAVELVKEEVSQASDLVLSSHCPGFAVYAEKTQPPEITNRLSRVRSPDQIAGLYLKTVAPGLAKRLAIALRRSPGNRHPESLYHVVVSPCFDKKLEILREPYKGSVDLVLTTNELIELVNRKTGLEVKKRLGGLERAALLGLNRAYAVVAAHSEGGGFAQAVLDAETPDAETWKTQRNRDLSQAQISGQKLLLRAYGFRNIQNVVRRVLTGDLATKAKFAEVMACPSACRLGGGQPREIIPDIEKEEYKGMWGKMKKWLQGHGTWLGLRKTEEEDYGEATHAMVPDEQLMEFVKAEIHKVAPGKTLREILSVEWKSIQSSSLKW